MEHIGSISLHREVTTQTKEFAHIARCLMLAKGDASLAASAAKSPRAASILAAGAASMWPPSIADQKAAMAGVKTGGLSRHDVHDALGCRDCRVSSYRPELYRRPKRLLRF